MKSIRLENIRCLEDTGYIDIKPLTIILGENSSGKSTFVRTFPLLRQSVSENPRGPILFYGNYVDFGELNNLITKESNSNCIALSFKFDVNFASLFNYKFKNDDHFEVNIAISIKDQGGNIPYISKFEIRFHNYKIEMELASDGITSVSANGEIFDKYFLDVKPHDDGRLLPYLTEKRSWENAPLGYFDSPLVGANSNWSSMCLPAKLEQELFLLAKSQHRNGSSRDSVYELLQILSFRALRAGNIISIMKDLGSQTWKKNASKITINKSKSIEFKKIENIISLSIASLISERLNNLMKETLLNVKYVAPVRATAERYYRKRNIAVSEVDFRGENLPMYVASLKDHELEKLAIWLEENFSLRLKLGKETGHLTLDIQHVGSDYIFNIADMGFGFSQVMPILVQLWSIIQKSSISLKRYKVPIIYVMEQPELHLHPKLQATLATVLCKAVTAARKSNIDLRIIIETHSESIVGKIGKNIASNLITEDITNLIIFNKLPTENTSSVSVAKYNNKGQLENWPWGFFD